MSTRMNEEDWANTIEVFRACLPRRGRKAADDRLFLEAMHFFTVENVRWRALPERFGHWNSVWKRFDRLSKAGVFEAFFDAVAGLVENFGEEGGFVLLVGLVRNDRGYASGPRGGAVCLAGIALVADGGARRDIRSDVEQGDEVWRVGLFATGQVETDHGSRCI